MENGRDTRTENEMIGDFQYPNTVSALIKNDDTYIGVIDYMMENQKDHTPRLGLIMIHNDYQGYGFGSQGYGFGSQGYGHYEKEMVERGANRIHLSINKENAKAQSFFGNH